MKERIPEEWSKKDDTKLFLSIAAVIIVMFCISLAASLVALWIYMK